jgi:hypothetical protein
MPAAAAVAAMDGLLRGPVVVLRVLLLVPAAGSASAGSHRTAAAPSSGTIPLLRLCARLQGAHTAASSGQASSQRRASAEGARGEQVAIDQQQQQAQIQQSSRLSI